MKRECLIFLCAVLLLSSFGGNAFADNTDYDGMPVYSGEEAWKTIYQEVLENEYKEKDQDGLEIRYTIWDIDVDSQPELIVTTRTCDADHTAYIYTIQRGVAVKIGTFAVFVGSIYGDVSGEGLFLYKGWMGAYGIYRYSYNDRQGIHSEEIVSGGLGEEEFNYPDITDFIPGARKLVLVEISNRLVMEEYGTIPDYMNGVFPKSYSLFFPNDDPNFYLKTIFYNMPVSWSWIGDGTAQGEIHFQDLVHEISSNYDMLEIRKMHVADLNGDGKAECVLELYGINSFYCTKRFYLSEQNGMTHVYVGDASDEYSYTYGNMTVDFNGSILLSTSIYPGVPETRSLIRLVFDGDESFIQELPVLYYANI